jgi:signal transduction histidine kinase/DNA-binding response OmpR family regulator
MQNRTTVIYSHIYSNYAMIFNMAISKDRILVVESDPIISDLVGRQALQSMGYQVQIVGDASSAIPQALQFAPDLLIVDMNLPGLSGKDFLVALSSQGIATPVIVIAQKGMEGDIIQAFRLGATDYLLWPLKDAEVVTAVERVLKQIRERRERDHLAHQLQQTNQELQYRLRELTILFSVGKAVTSITDQRALFDKIVEGGIKVTQSDLGWFLLKDESAKIYNLAAHHGLPNSLVGRLNQPWDDGISSLVSMSGESLSIYGEPLKRFKIASLGQAALIVPIKVQKQVIGLLVVVRKTSKAYTQSDQNLLEAVSDYAAISLVNARLFRALEERASSAVQTAEKSIVGEKIKNELLQAVEQELRLPLGFAGGAVDRLLESPSTRPAQELRPILISVQENLQEANKLIETLAAMQQPIQARQGAAVNLNEIANLSLKHMKPLAQLNELTLVCEPASEPVLVQADASQLTQAIDGLLSNAIKSSPTGGKVVVHVDKVQNGSPHLSVCDFGIGIEARNLTRLFEKGFKVESSSVHRFGGLGIKLNLIREIITTIGGKIWAESQPGHGTTIHVVLPIPR